MKFSLSVILFLTLIGQSFGQTTQIQGVVTDSLTGDPVPFVKVKIINGTGGTLTDTSGYYTLLVKPTEDSVEFSFIGYKTKIYQITPGIPNEINVQLIQDIRSFDVVEIIAGENPAYEILRKVDEHRDENNPDKLEAYQCEVYNIMQFDVNKLGEDFENNKAFRKMQVINDYVDRDTTIDSKYLPVLLTESISDYYYKSSPTQKKEEIKASRVTGVDYLQLQQFTGDMYQSVNIYENYVELFNKEFMSPIANGGKIFYKYYLQEEDTIDGVFCHHIKFVPRRKGDAVFQGDIWIADSSFAVKKVTAKIPDNVNLNYCSDLFIEQNYTELDSGQWMLTDEQMIGYFDLFNDLKKKRLIGATVHKRTSRKNFVFNDPQPFDFYVADVVLTDSAKQRTDDYWDSNRHSELSQEEQGVINMVDSLKNNRRFKFYENLTYFAYTGFWRAKYIEFGSIYSVYNRNTVEGHRVMLNVRTSNRFSTKVELNAFGSYGFQDTVSPQAAGGPWKYGASIRWKVRNAPREMMRFAYKRRIEQLGLSASIGDIGNSFSTLLSLGPLDKLTMVQNASWSFEKDWVADMRTFNAVEWKRFVPLGTSDYSKIDQSTGDTIRVNRLTSFEIRNQIMFTKEEKFLNGQFDRISLGSKYPIISLTHTWGIKDVLESDYNFHRLDFVYDHRPRVGMFGRIQYSIYAGKIFGTVPYPFLNIHQGNQTLYLQRTTFNLMRYYEFISDEWVGVNFEHRLQGFFMDRIPLIKKLKLRLVYNAKMVIGRYNNRHSSELLLPTYSKRLQYPYYEVGVGLENILKFIRIDAVWRLSYRDHVYYLPGDPVPKNVRNFGVFFTFTSDF
ncbi:MAG: carboxypeptidase-like regulatory domain-containing protein [Crocinitomicaceae bacterium]|nr:carboxypeptidase-like regulatory domain-containing protein [Crocinitomicaceae bacterium]